MIVADVNTIAYFWIQGDKTRFAEQVIRKDPVWAVPLLWRSEFCNLMLGYVRRGEASMDDALRTIRLAEDHLRATSYRIPSDRVMAVAAESDLSAYDCEYVALAIELGVKLVTSDRQILRSFPVVAAKLEDFAGG